MSTTVNDVASAGRCHACGCVGENPGQPLSEEVILAEFQKLREKYWTLSDDRKFLSKSFVCRNFAAAIKYINDAATIAERNEINHHPDMHLTSYRNVEVKLFTHAVNGLTTYDFILAKALEEVEIDYSPKWLKSQTSF